MNAVLRRFIQDESAADVVEYAYLTLFVGLAGAVVWGTVVGLLGDRYEDYNHGVQDQWEAEDLTAP